MSKNIGVEGAQIKVKGFERATLEVEPKRIILSLEGPEKEGKTHFALTAPAPIAFVNIDNGTEGVIGKFLAQKEIYLHCVAVPTSLGGQVDVAECEKLWDACKTAYLDALNTRGLRTIIIDTATEAWELLRLARFGKLAQVLPYHYAPVNAEFRDLVRAAYRTDKNVIFVHKLKPMYINDKRTKDYERAGFGDLGYLVQCNARMGRDTETGEFNLRVLNCRQNPDMAGVDFTGVMCNFPFFAAGVFPDSDPEKWE